ncbi:MAG: hypothetical protein IJF19_00030 [Clostridia bacterium]|nr:hypothetical protein [Clostridia bacterium]
MRKKLYLILILLLAVMCILTGCKKIYTYTDVSDYGKFNNSDCVINFDLGIFPGAINEDICNEYFYSWSRGLMDDSCQIYLDCTYNEDNFNTEKERIENLSSGVYSEEYTQKVSDSGISGIIYDELSFKTPAYVLTMVEGRQYAYIFLFEEENRIIYIGLQYCPINNVRFDRDFLPLNYSDFSHI